MLKSNGFPFVPLATIASLAAVLALAVPALRGGGSGPAVSDFQRQRQARDTLLDSAAVFAAYSRAVRSTTPAGTDTLIWADSAVHFYGWREDNVERHYLVAWMLIERAHRQLLAGEDRDTPFRIAATLKLVREPLTEDLRRSLQRAWAMAGQSAAAPGAAGRLQSELDGRRPPSIGNSTASKRINHGAERLAILTNAAASVVVDLPSGPWRIRTRMFVAGPCTLRITEARHSPVPELNDSSSVAVNLGDYDSAAVVAPWTEYPLWEVRSQGGALSPRSIDLSFNSEGVARLAGEYLSESIRYCRLDEP